MATKMKYVGFVRQNETFDFSRTDQIIYEKKTKKNNIWMFRSNKEMMIEKSIFVRNDIANETKQIVISGITSKLNTKVEWSLEKI